MRDETMEWRTMESAPRDGSRIIVAIRGSEQGVADVDIVRWAKPRNEAEESWVSSESTYDCPIAYEGAEVLHWMPLPSTMPAVRSPGLAARLPAVPRDGQEIGGSGI